MHIPFNKPHLTGRESLLVNEALRNGHFSGDGPFTKRCCKLIEQLTGCPKAILTTSCTHALEIAALLLEIQPGDEVILPSFTFVSTANAFVLRGAIPVFADIRPDTLNMDETKLEPLITRRTRAIVPVHYAGVGCEMDAILAIAEHHKIAVVEDNAHGFGAKYKDRTLGTLGSIGAQSFHETKNLSCGEGGALILNHPELSEEAQIIRDKGTNRALFLRGEIDKYTWVSKGSSYAPADILAAFLLAQLEEFQSIQARRKQIWDYYQVNLSPLQKGGFLELPTVPVHCVQSFHMFYIVARTQREQNQLLNFLNQNGVNAVFHYVPLHSSNMGLRLGGEPDACPVTEDMSKRLVRLPFFNRLERSDQDHVISNVHAFFEKRT